MPSIAMPMTSYETIRGHVAHITHIIDQPRLTKRGKEDILLSLEAIQKELDEYDYEIKERTKYV